MAETPHKADWDWIEAHFGDAATDARFPWAKHMVGLIKDLRADASARSLFPSLSLHSFILSVEPVWPQRYQQPHVVVRPAQQDFEVQVYLDIWPDRGYWNDNRPFHRTLVPYFALREAVQNGIDDVLKVLIP